MKMGKDQILNFMDLLLIEEYCALKGRENRFVFKSNWAVFTVKSAWHNPAWSSEWHTLCFHPVAAPESPRPAPLLQHQNLEAKKANITPWRGRRQQVWPLFSCLHFVEKSSFCLVDKNQGGHFSFSLLPAAALSRTIEGLFWADTAPFNGPQPYLLHCIHNFRDTRAPSGGSR